MKDLIILLAEGFEEVEALTILDMARRANLICDLVSTEKELLVLSSHNVKIKADKLLEDINPNHYRALYIPGGLPGAVNLSENKKVLNLIKDFYEDGKLVCAICAGPIALDKAGLLKDKNFTCFPGFQENLSIKNPKDLPICIDDNIVTAMGPGLAIAMGMKIVELLKNKAEMETMAQGFLIPKLRQFIKDDLI